ncbi:polymorphic toxin type 15 domain-containing protein [Zophobihabitans entericus]|uniref:polymorphic toxin type 15 domain-containing protein n=1 Tax=Zophobihabitans entericus TaxID=1635327 RepID=UPI00389A6AF3
MAKAKGKAGEGKAWLHEPDMCAGRAPEDISGVGDSRTNSIIGGNSRTIADTIMALPNDSKIEKFRYILKIT